MDSPDWETAIASVRVRQRAIASPSVRDELSKCFKTANTWEAF
jgi:hypothetical protein